MALLDTHSNQPQNPQKNPLVAQGFIAIYVALGLVLVACLGYLLVFYPLGWYPMSVEGPRPDGDHFGLLFWNWHYTIHLVALALVALGTWRTGFIYFLIDSLKVPARVGSLRREIGKLMLVLGIIVMILNATILPRTGHMTVLALHKLVANDLKDLTSRLEAMRGMHGRYPATLEEAQLEMYPQSGTKGLWLDVYDRFSRSERLYQYVSDGESWILFSVGPDGVGQVPPSPSNLQHIEAYLEKAKEFEFNPFRRPFHRADIIWTSDGHMLPDPTNVPLWGEDWFYL